MIEQRQELGIREESSVLAPLIIVTSVPSSTLLRSNFSGAIYLYFEPKEYTTLTPSHLEPLTTIIELEDSEVDEILKKPPLIDKETYKALLEYIETKARERNLRLSDDVKKALANLMIFIAKKLDEEI
ncbi:MAG: hypothetical protein QXM43_09895 [Desulfurococcaceae archaeon]